MHEKKFQRYSQETQALCGVLGTDRTVCNQASGQNKYEGADLTNYATPCTNNLITYSQG